MQEVLITILVALIGLTGWLGRRILSQLDDISGRTTRVEFILTGDKGMNGIRQEVKDLKAQIEEVKTVLFNQNEAAHERLGEWSLWRQNVDNTLQPPPRPRRKNSGRRALDRKRKAA